MVSGQLRIHMHIHTHFSIYSSLPSLLSFESPRSTLERGGQSLEGVYLGEVPGLESILKVPELSASVLLAKIEKF